MGFQTNLTDGKPTNGANPWIDSLVWGGAWDDNDGGKVDISYRFRPQGQIDSPYVFGQTSLATAWLAFEKDAMRKVIATWEAVARVNFRETTNVADIEFLRFNQADTDAFIGANPEDGTLGFHDVPEAGQDFAFGGFSYEAEGWNSAGLKPGGLGYAVLLHELGHGLGLSHPHGSDFPADATAFPGVFTDTDFGQYNLNQGIFTAMTYNDGWPQRFQNHIATDFGLQMTPMALDIAAVQAIYGANKDYRTGNDVYVLQGVNAPGTGWACIWDAGGRDTISAGVASFRAFINLNEAPLEGPNAGGYISKIAGIIGGFTIAHNTTIENAIGSKGADQLIGNNANNWLSGLAGDDQIYGGKGDDSISGGIGRDVLGGQGGDDKFIYKSIDAAGDSIRQFGEGDLILFTGSNFGNLKVGQLAAFRFVARFDNKAQDIYDRFIFKTADDTLWFDQDGSGAAAPVMILDLSNDFNMTSSDIMII